MKFASHSYSWLCESRGCEHRVNPPQWKEGFHWWCGSEGCDPTTRLWGPIDPDRYNSLPDRLDGTELYYGSLVQKKDEPFKFYIKCQKCHPDHLSQVSGWLGWGKWMVVVVALVGLWWILGQPQSTSRTQGRLSFFGVLLPSFWIVAFLTLALYFLYRFRKVQKKSRLRNTLAACFASLLLIIFINAILEADIFWMVTSLSLAFFISLEKEKDPKIRGGLHRWLQYLCMFLLFVWLMVIFVVFAAPLTSI